MKRTDIKSHCPINFSLEVFGDPWALLIVRDIASYGKHTYGEFLGSKEKISTRMLAMRLKGLENKGIIIRKPHPTDHRKDLYYLTPKGEAALPILIELATWGSTFDSKTDAPQVWKDAVATDTRLSEPTHAARRPFFNNGRKNRD